MCFGVGSHQFGHVAIVEEIHDDDTVTLSQSDYFGDLFSTVRIGKNSNIYGLPFQGFIRNPINFGDPIVKPKSKYKFFNLNRIRRITIGG